jgi:hypothetical protein
MDWLEHFILFHHKCYPNEMGASEIKAFSTEVAVKQNMSSSTPQQALSALLFLYCEVLCQEVQSVLAYLQGDVWLMARLLYGSGLCLMECLRSRVQDIDFAYLQVLACSLEN